jgi:hypothetical protein
MQNCKKLINTILILDDYVAIDARVAAYIQCSLPLLDENKSMKNEEQIYVEYSELLHNLTSIVNDIQQKLPVNINI